MTLIRASICARDAYLPDGALQIAVQSADSFKITIRIRPSDGYKGRLSTVLTDEMLDGVKVASDSDESAGSDLLARGEDAKVSETDGFGYARESAGGANGRHSVKKALLSLLDDFRKSPVGTGSVPRAGAG